MEDDIVPYIMAVIVVILMLIGGCGVNEGRKMGIYEMQKEATTKGYGSFEVVDNHVEFKWKE